MTLKSSIAGFLIVAFSLTVVPPSVRGFQVQTLPMTTSMRSGGGLQMAIEGPSELPLSSELETFDDPCWQNMLDDDCSMGNIYAANFVPAKWIKSMPCGEGIEDCDMPNELTSPDARHESGVDNVDVMKVLGLKRAASINTGNP